MNYPTGDEPVYVEVLAKYKRYKPQSNQAKQGLSGRWQVWNGYGWNNTDMQIQNWEVITKNGASWNKEYLIQLIHQKIEQIAELESKCETLDSKLTLYMLKYITADNKLQKELRK
jgi:hypothetical protein